LCSQRTFATNDILLHQNPKQAMKALTPAGRFWKLLKPDSSDIRNIYIYSVFNGLVNLSLPLGIQAIVNLIQAGEVNSAWIVLIFFVVIGIVISGIMTIIQLRITETLQQRIFTRAAFEFVFRIPRIRMEALYKHYAPELMNRFFDIIGVQKGLSKILIDISAASLQVIFGLILLSLYHPFFLIFSVTLLILVFLGLKLTIKRGLHTSMVESKHKYKVAHWLEEVARVSSTFKLAGSTDLPISRMDKYVRNYVDAREEHFKILRFQYSFMVGFKAIVALGLLSIGGFLVMEQVLNIGQFVAAEIIILLMINSVEKLVVSLETIYDVLTSLEKIGQVMDLELEKNTGRVLEKSPDNPAIEIELNDVSFSYPESNKKVLRNIELHIKPNERILISGTNGSGKSSLIHIIAGLYKIQEGSILYQGINIGSYTKDSIRAAIGGCLSDEQLFEGTLTENITLSRPGVTRADVEWAIEKAGLKNWVKTLPLGYDNPLDPVGSKLSRSVIQKILIARGIVDKPGLLLLEYAFDQIDYDDRKQIIDFLIAKDNPWTLIAVSNDDYLAKNVDKIVLMNAGTIEHVDSYEKLKNFFNFKKTGGDA
jgi:ABC-type bacteriocin/lantibiotic exporter with double-glycine peptidase domain